MKKTKSKKAAKAPKAIIVKSNEDVVVMKSAPKPKKGKAKTGGSK